MKFSFFGIFFLLSHKHEQKKENDRKKEKIQDVIKEKQV